MPLDADRPMTDAALPRAHGLPAADWNDTARSYPQVLLHEAFEAQAAGRQTRPRSGSATRPSAIASWTSVSTSLPDTSSSMGPGRAP